MRYCSKCVMPDTRPGIKFVRLDEFEKAQNQGKKSQIQGENASKKLNLSKSDNFSCENSNPSQSKEKWLCSACINHLNKDKINYTARFKELEALCDKHRHRNGKGEYDCAIAVSGGKDSHFQVYTMKERLGMNPVLFSVEDNFTMTEAGKKNLSNLSAEFGCHIISLKPDRRTQKAVMRKTFERYGKPTWFIDRLIYSYPFAMALKFNTLTRIWRKCKL